MNFGGGLTSLIIIIIILCEVFLRCGVSFCPFDASITSTTKICYYL